MNLEIISSEGIVFQGEVTKVTFPGELGSFTVLEGHASLLSTLVPGIIEYETGGELKTVDIDGGFVDVITGSPFAFVKGKQSLAGLLQKRKRNEAYFNILDGIIALFVYAFCGICIGRGRTVQCQRGDL